jgi:hypothetical protein
MENPQLAQAHLDRSHPLLAYLARERPELDEQPRDAVQRYIDCVNVYLDEEVFFCCQVDRYSFGVVCQCGRWMDEIPGSERSAAAIRSVAGEMLRHYERQHAKSSAGVMVSRDFDRW